MAEAVPLAAVTTMRPVYSVLYVSSSFAEPANFVSSAAFNALNENSPAVALAPRVTFVLLLWSAGTCT